ncbi:MAG TPA: adenylate/guanylate cyclase domain-containing protein [Burkholderiales bacterium]|jgi:adenylate cyclase|nr:adenylate/guanylate cyclase domain-containing protein [Burkholderiales bacterium]
MPEPAAAGPQRRELSRLGLLGPEDGWSLAPVGAWIMIEGRHIGDPRELLEALAARLDAAGATIDRLGFTVRTIHPQIAAWGCYWSRRGGSGMFVGRHGTQNSDAYIGSPVQFVYENRLPYRRRLEALDEQRDPALLHELRAEGLTDYYGLPLWLGSGEVNFMTAATARPGGFSDDDLDRLGALANLIAPLVEAIHARRMTLGLLDAFVGPRIGRRILDGQVKRGDGDRIEAAFWYSDLRGFTALSESLPAGELLQLLNEYFEACAAAASARGGEILQFIGDAVLIIFEIRRLEDETRVCEDALDAAVDAFSAIAVTNHRRRHAGLREIAFGLGLHLGTVTHANVGAPDRLAFNVVGPAVNKTARLQAMTKLAGEPLLLSKEFAARVRRPLRSIGHFDLKGIDGPQEMFTLEEGA